MSRATPESRASSGHDDADILTSLVDLADASQSLAVDQFRLLRLETVEELRRLVAWVIVVAPVAGLVVLGAGLVLGGTVVGLSDALGWTGALVTTGVGALGLAMALVALGARVLAPRREPGAEP